MMTFSKDQKDLIAKALDFYASHLDRAANEAFETSPDFGNGMCEAFKGKAMSVRFVYNRVIESSVIQYNRDI